MKKLLLTLATVLLISGCSKEPNIILNCMGDQNDGMNLTIDSSKKELIFSVISFGEKQPDIVLSYTDNDDELVSEKFFRGPKNAYYITTFNKIDGELKQEKYDDDGYSRKDTKTNQCSVIKRVME
tara:strand:- start:2020 stop:2394 length:375 start_codon:yes stop_codon:yes gene_type:complete